LKIQECTICLNTPYGKVELMARGYLCLKVPELGIAIYDAPNSLIARLVTGMLQGNVDENVIKCLVELSKLNTRYHDYVFSQIEQSPAHAIQLIQNFQQFEEQGYRYFPQSKQLFVKPTANSSVAFLVQFRGPKQAKCYSILHIAETLVEGINKGQIVNNIMLAWSPTVSPEQATITEKAVSQLQLPYPEVAKIIRLISSYSSATMQRQLFDWLENGAFSNAEKLRQLEEKVRVREENKATQRKYEEAQNQDFVFLQDTEELLFPDDRVLINLGTERPSACIVTSSCEFEMGRYVVTRRWGRSAKLEKRLPDDNPLWRERVIKKGKNALATLPEPYRSRLTTLLVELSLSA